MFGIPDTIITYNGPQFIGNSFQAFVKEYGIQGIPRFILVDKEGIIISADAARPSDPALKEILQELL